MNVFDGNEIVPGLFLGSENAGSVLEELQARNIRSVLIPAQTGCPAILFPEQLTYLQLNIPDVAGFPLGACFQDCFSFLERGLKCGAVLVHCAQGKSRSAAVVVAFLMWRDKLTFANALHLVKSKRPVVSTKFESLLVEFEHDPDRVLAQKKHKLNAAPLFAN